MLSDAGFAGAYLCAMRCLDFGFRLRGAGHALYGRLKRLGGAETVLAVQPEL